MVRAVDLDELAEAAAAGAQLVDRRRALAPAQPEPGCGHPLAQRLAADVDAVQLGELLLRQRRPEVGIPLADQADRMRLQARWQLVIARPAALAGHQPHSSARLERLAKPSDLPRCQTQQNSRLYLRVPVLNHPPNHLETVQLHGAHRDQLPSHPSASRATGGRPKRTFLFG
jgi:hypothetical protein